MALVMKNLITAIYALLIADNTLTALITGVFNEVPQKQTFPYVVLGNDDLFERKFNTFGNKGKETHIFIHVYSLYKGDSEALGIAERIDTLLDWTALSITSNTHIVTSFEGLQMLREEDTQQINVRHAVLEYKIMTQAS